VISGKLRQPAPHLRRWTSRTSRSRGVTASQGWRSMNFTLRHNPPSPRPMARASTHRVPRPVVGSFAVTRTTQSRRMIRTLFPRLDRPMQKPAP
jgi:hypothetical protein